jgi:hypothetical protein
MAHRPHGWDDYYREHGDDGNDESDGTPPQRPKEIPHTPDPRYKDLGWRLWGDWLRDK